MKTLEAHKKDIGGRIGGGIQEDIIAFVQKSDKYELIKQHYLVLLHKNEFEKQVKELSKKVHDSFSVLKIEQRPNLNKSSLFNLFMDHLKLSGIKVISGDKKIEKGKHNFLNLTILPVKYGSKHEGLKQKLFLHFDQE